MNALEKHFLENNIITNKQAEEIGIKRHILASLVHKGELERVRNGVYKKKDAIDDDFTAISVNNEQMVFSFHTALYLLGFSDRTPNVFHITVPQGYNAEHIKRKFLNIKVHYVKRDCFNLGLIKTKTPLGSTVKCYNMERCICDIVLKRKSIDKQIFINALTGYFKSKEKNTRNLIKYSRILGIEEEIRKYLEIL
jgi:hypothetical protein